MVSRLVKLLVSTIVWCLDCSIDPVRAAFGGKVASRPVILFYHAVPAAHRERFHRQMAMVKRLTRLSPLAEIPPSSIGKPWCAVTFDDGYVSSLENAFTWLVEQKLPFTVFIPTGSIGMRPQWVVDPNHRYFKETVMDEAQIRTLAATTVCTIAAHSVTHPNFLKLTELEAERELRESKQALERIVGHEMVFFSFPHGKYSAAHEVIARKVGYRRIYSIEPACAFRHSGEYTTARFLVRTSDWPCELFLTLKGAYRWLAPALRLRDRILRMIKKRGT